MCIRDSKGIPLTIATVSALYEVYGLEVGYCYNRKEKKTHGEGGRLVGAPPVGNILIIDDVITAGTAVTQILQLLNDKQEARVVGVVVGLDRREIADDDNTVAQKLQKKFNIPNMMEGGLDVAWLVVYSAQGELNEEGYRSAMDNAIAKFDAIDRLVDEYAPDKLEIALNSDDVRRILSNDKKVIMIGVAEEVKKEVQTDMFASLIKADTKLIDEKHSGKFISNLINDVNWITNLLSTAILNFFKDTLTLIGLLSVMFYQNWKLSLIAIIMIPLASFAARSLGKRIGKVTNEQMHKTCLLYTSPSPRDATLSRMPSSA